MQHTTQFKQYGKSIQVNEYDEVMIYDMMKQWWSCDIEYDNRHWSNAIMCSTNRCGGENNGRNGKTDRSHVIQWVVLNTMGIAINIVFMKIPCYLNHIYTINSFDIITAKTSGSRY